MEQGPLAKLVRRGRARYLAAISTERRRLTKSLACSNTVRPVTATTRSSSKRLDVGHHVGHPILFGTDVNVRDGDPFTGGLLNRPLAAGRQTKGGWWWTVKGNLVPSGRGRGKYRFCTVVRTIVDDQNFDVGVRLVEKGLQTPFNPMSAVTHTYGNGDLGPRH